MSPATRIVPVILAGGSGERLWPLSKVDYPKQFIAFDGQGPSLFQETLARVADRAMFAAPLIVCHEDHRFIVSEQLRQVGCKDATIIVEPVARNTAPAITIAALHAAPDAILFAIPSDHRIQQTANLLSAVESGVPAAQDGWIVTFAITPNTPEIGYGYINSGQPLASCPGVSAISRFIEKPDMATALSYLAEGSYGWNSGMFLMSATAVIDDMQIHAPEVLDACKRGHAASTKDGAFIRPDSVTMHACPSISFDHALMEKTTRGAVITVDIGWSDLGSWTALDEATAKDAFGNALIGRTVTEDVSGCYIRSGDSLVAAIGLRDMVVIAADNAVMIGPKNRMQEVKNLIRQMRASDVPDTHLTSFSHRPWGGFFTVDRGEQYQVKKLHNRPGGKISLQSHSKRSEHWVVVKGVATVTRGDEIYELTANESTYISAGFVHRLENRGTDDLIVIEVQTGEYLGEDDIVRHEDAYMRS